MAVTLKFQSSGAIPNNDAPVTLRGTNLTIGRGDENDLVLPDPDRVISKTHCVIEDHNGNIVVVDLSTNGTFLNYGKVALGPTPTPLNHGDVLVIGAYELVVDIAQPRETDTIAAPAAQAQVSHGQADRAPDPLALLDDSGPRADFLDELLGGETPRGPAGVRREDPMEDLLPPLGAGDDPLLGPAPDDPADMPGASAGSHTQSVNDSFSPRGQQAAIIPDDWDDDFLNPNPPPRAPGRQAEPLQPPDPLDDLLGPGPLEPPPGPDGPHAAPHAAPADPLGDLPGPVPADDAPSSGSAADALPEALPEALPDAPAPAPELQQAGPRTAAAAPEVRDHRPPASEPAPPATTDTAARAFLDAAGAADVVVPDADLTATMARLGRVMRIMVEGMREILMTRTSIKSEFRISQTMIGAGRNNPLKFSVSPEQAIEAMVRPASRGYLDAATAAEEALQDIKAHEVAMVTGMEAALKGVLRRLDPKTLEGKIEGSGGVSGLLKGRKARYWEVYEKLYAEISDQAEGDFHDLFAREFARAYQEQLERLK